MFSKWFDRFLQPQFEEINNARLHAIVRGEVERVLGPRGFEAAGDLKWVRDRDAPIRQVFAFTKWKGGVVGPSWGVSLDFVPHLSGQQLRWHRSNKAAKLDLCIDARDRALLMSYINGERVIRQAHRGIIGSALDQANGFWARCEGVSALPGAIEWLKTYYAPKDGLGFYNYTQHPLTVAFVLAKTGRRDEALAEVASHCCRWRPEALERLKKFLELAAGQ